jgi:16S rRNA processing protein RimM
LTDEEPWLRAGVVGRPHGLDGSFHVSEPVVGLLEQDAVVRVAGAERRIARLAGFAARPIVRLEGDADRASAEALRGEPMLVPRDRAPALEPDEWWATDLVGCTVSDGDVKIGVVRRLLALPSCEVLEVQRSEGAPDLLVPLVRDAVRDVDIARAAIDIDLRFLGETE